MRIRLIGIEGGVTKEVIEESPSCYIVQGNGREDFGFLAYPKSEFEPVPEGGAA